jgi:hypothetical protein
MIETVFALLMFLNGKLENYSPKATVADCLEQKEKLKEMEIQIQLNGNVKK